MPPQFFDLSDSTITLRPVTEADGELLYEIYASTRDEEMSLFSFWNDKQKEMFLRQQFNAQRKHYQQTFKDAFYWIVQQNDVPIGRLYFDTSPEKYCSIIEITLLPNFRKKGIGESLIKDLLAYSSKQFKSVRLHVEIHNPAKRLYDRLGFTIIDIGLVSVEMQRQFLP